MERKFYEVHNLGDQHLPIIFHHDVILDSEYHWANWHENIEILYCTSGAGQILCNAVEYDVKAGDMLVINSNVLHGAKKEKELQYHCLIVDTDFLAAHEIKVADIEFEGLVQSETARELYEKVVEEVQNESEYRVAGIRVQVLNLILYLVRNHSVKMPVGRRNRLESDENIRIAIGFMKSNFARRLTLEDIAGEVGLSKYHFAHEFKKTTGMTVVNFLNVIRCRNAKILLLKKKYSVSEVAGMCGFENDSYFSRTFKNIMGKLPSEIK